MDPGVNDKERLVKTTNKTRTRDLLAGQTILARKRAELIACLRDQVAMLTMENMRLRRELDDARRDRRAA